MKLGLLLSSCLSLAGFLFYITNGYEILSISDLWIVSGLLGIALVTWLLSEKILK